MAQLQRGGTGMEHGLLWPRMPGAGRAPELMCVCSPGLQPAAPLWRTGVEWSFLPGFAIGGCGRYPQSQAARPSRSRVGQRGQHPAQLPHSSRAVTRAGRYPRWRGSKGLGLSRCVSFCRGDLQPSGAVCEPGTSSALSHRPCSSQSRVQRL